MVTFSKIKDGLLRYVDNEVLPQMSGLRRVGMATYMTLAADRLEASVAQYARNPAVEMLGIVDGDRVDIDRLMEAFTASFGDRQTLSVPLFGDFTFTRADLDRLRDYIGRE